jgi:hypothetical protein
MHTKSDGKIIIWRKKELARRLNTVRSVRNASEESAKKEMAS